jgi:hypothetical protein
VFRPGDRRTGCRLDQDKRPAKIGGDGMKSLQIRIPDDVLNRLRAQADCSFRSINSEVLYALDRHLSGAKSQQEPLGAPGIEIDRSATGSEHSK